MRFTHGSLARWHSLHACAYSCRDHQPTPREKAEADEMMRQIDENVLTKKYAKLLADRSYDPKDFACYYPKKRRLADKRIPISLYNLQKRIRLKRKIEKLRLKVLKQQKRLMGIGVIDSKWTRHLVRELGGELATEERQEDEQEEKGALEFIETFEKKVK